MFKLLLLFTFVFTFSTCDLFNASIDEDFLKKIDEEIAYANAPWVPVQIVTGGLGVSNPLQGSHEKIVKKGYSFILRFQPFSNYPFQGWQAWVEGESVLAHWKSDEDYSGEDKVKFVPLNADGTEVQIFVYEIPSDNSIIRIGPLGVDTSNIEVRVIADSRWGTVFTAPVRNCRPKM